MLATVSGGLTPRCVTVRMSNVASVLRLICGLHARVHVLGCVCLCTRVHGCHICTRVCTCACTPAQALWFGVALCILSLTCCMALWWLDNDAAAVMAADDHLVIAP